MAHELKEGILALVNLSKEEMDLLLEVLSKVRGNTQLDHLKLVFEMKDLMSFIDTFSGETIKVPTREDIMKRVVHIKIYNYCYKRGFSEESRKSASLIYKKRLLNINKVIEKIDRILEKEIEDEES